MPFFCALCSAPVQIGERFDREVRGWERKALGGSRRGGSDIALREHTDRVAHSRCVELARSGVSAHQEQLA